MLFYKNHNIVYYNVYSDYLDVFIEKYNMHTLLPVARWLLCLQ